MRPGRLDRILYVAPPDRQARVDIFNVNFERMAVHEDVDVAKLADVVGDCFISFAERSNPKRVFFVELILVSVCFLWGWALAVFYRRTAVRERRSSAYVRMQLSML